MGFTIILKILVESCYCRIYYIANLKHGTTVFPSEKQKQLDNTVIHLLDGLIYLNRSDLEKKLNTRNRKSGDNTLFDNGLFFDLSQCRVCELVAIAKLILVIDN